MWSFAEAAPGDWSTQPPNSQASQAVGAPTQRGTGYRGARVSKAHREPVGSLRQARCTGGLPGEQLTKRPFRGHRSPLSILVTLRTQPPEETHLHFGRCSAQRQESRTAQTGSGRSPGPCLLLCREARPRVGDWPLLPPHHGAAVQSRGVGPQGPAESVRRRSAQRPPSVEGHSELRGLWAAFTGWGLV